MKKYTLILFTVIMAVFTACNNNTSNSEQQTSAADTDLSNPSLNSFNKEAIDDMLRVKAVDANAYYTQFQSQDVFNPIDSFESLTFDKPYQAAVSDPDGYSESVAKLIDIYLLSNKSHESQQQYDCRNYNYYSTTEIMNTTLLAGDRNEYVMVVAFRYSLTGDEPDSFSKTVSSWSTVCTSDNMEYLYGTVAVHAIMVKDYIYELTGIANASEVVEAFSNKYPDKTSLYDSVEYAMAAPEPVCKASVQSSKLQVTYDNGKNWTNVPVSTDILYSRGDQQAGVLTDIQSGSYYVSNDLTIFAYGGSKEVPLSVIVSTDAGKSWSKHVISNSPDDVRAIWISSPSQGHIYAGISVGRTMSQEGNRIYCSMDSGSTWNELDTVSDLLNIHFLTNAITFTDDNTGFICIKSADVPSILVTNDEGKTWEVSDISSVPKGYSSPFAPVIQDNKLVMYVRESGSSNNSGAMYEMISSDNGKSWTIGRHVVIK